MAAATGTVSMTDARARHLGTRLASWLFPMGGVASFAAAALATKPTVEVVVFGIVAVAAGGALYAWGDRIPVGWMPVVPVFGTLLITAAVATSAETACARLVSLYILVGCVGFFVPRRFAVLHLLFAIGCCITVVLVRSEESVRAAGMIAAGATLTLGVVMIALRRSTGVDRTYGLATTAAAVDPGAVPEPQSVRASIVDELAAALAANDFDVFYQPITRIAAPERVTAVEALFRWRSTVAPDIVTAALIGLAEESGLVTKLGFGVLDRACRDAHRLQAAAGHPLIIHVNVCGADLLTDGYLDAVDAILTETHWPAEQLVLEVTERVADADTLAAVSTLRLLRAHGIGIAIDDFGSGYSSLGRINELPVNLVKLDASFTAGPMSHPLLTAIASLGAALDIPIIAEGIETRRQATILLECGFTLGQGFLLGRPRPLDAVVASLADSGPGFPDQATG